MDLENLKDLRIAKNLTQIEIAKMVGVTMNAYRNWELGANKPSEENLEKLIQILNADD